MGKKNSQALQKADSLFEYGYFQLAEVAYGKLNYAFPKNDIPKELFYVKNRLAECHLRLGNPDQSLAELQVVLEQCQKLKNRPVEEAMAHTTQGLSWLAKGDPEG
ncbi:MAG: hypothetical protein K2Q22_17270, partial [Cytophagales bacterium]|nr:hypothetical protein [Cytophagales bacterium]